MSLPVDKARDIEREVKIKSAFGKEFPDREFVMKITWRGISMRRKGKTEDRSITWRQLIGMMLLHLEK